MYDFKCSLVIWWGRRNPQAVPAKPPMYCSDMLDNKEGNYNILESIQQVFHVSNCKVLGSLGTVTEAQDPENKMREVLSVGRCAIIAERSSDIAGTDHLPGDASSSGKLWLFHKCPNPQEPTFGLHWDCLQDTLRVQELNPGISPTDLRYIYKVLAFQYDP